jgi:hypothetical protein
MQDAESASPREEVAASGEKGADTELAVNDYLELKRIRIARNKTKGGPREIDTTPGSPYPVYTTVET